jgi:hypothetical protein
MTLSKISALRPVRFFFGTVCLCAALWPGRAPGQTERILSYDSRITLHEDGGMTVRETIRVEAAGIEIKRGIYRDFPTQYTDAARHKYVVGFEPVEVLRDGQPENFHTKKMSNGVRLYAGSENVFLDPGVYTYAITYNTDHQLGFFDGYDELYWNVTGNGWGFAIEKASATVELPGNISGRVLDAEAWTGVKGSKERAFRMDVGAWPSPRFETTRELAPGEGLTIVVSWPKGLIPEPSRRDKTIRMLRNNTGVGMALLGTLLLFAYYLSVWAKFGRDPEKGPIVPQFSAPDNMSPAAVRYLTEMGYDHKAFASALLNMGAKGFLKITDKGGAYTLTRLKDDTGALAPEEKKMAEALFPRKGSIELKQANHTAISRALEDMKKDLKTRFYKTHFFTNTVYFVPGLLLSIVLLAASTLSFGSPEAGFLTLWLSIWTIGVVFLLVLVFNAWKNVWQGRGKASSGIGALFITFFSIPFFAGEIFAFYGLWSNTSPVLIACLAAMVVMHIVFHRLLKAPTVLGRKALDKIEGFKMYLGTAEKERLNMTVPVDRTPETFERFLPYALALGVEQQWAEKFSDVLSSAGRAPSSSSYRPSWYEGGSVSSFNPASFVGSFGSSLSSAVSSSSTAPGSSSGSGGGGSSGGGGGGGGGGGW